LVKGIFRENVTVKEVPPTGKEVNGPFSLEEGLRERRGETLAPVLMGEKKNACPDNQRRRFLPGVKTGLQLREDPSPRGKGGRKGGQLGGEKLCLKRN